MCPALTESSFYFLQCWCLICQRNVRCDDVISINRSINLIIDYFSNRLIDCNRRRYCGQLWYTRRPGEDDMLRGRAYSTCEVQDSTAGVTPAVAAGPGGVEASKLATSLNLNGDVDIGEINLSEMNPEDIRVSCLSSSYPCAPVKWCVYFYFFY